jgi:hypothetical protein
VTTYRVPVSDSLLTQREYWQDVPGFRLISVDGPWLAHPDISICTFEDDDAPPELEGKLVEPTLRGSYPPDPAKVTVINRRVIKCP